MVLSSIKSIPLPMSPLSIELFPTTPFAVQTPILSVTVVSSVYLQTPILNRSLVWPPKIVIFNAFKTLLLISLKHHSFSPHLSSDSTVLSSTNSVSLLDLPIGFSLCWSSFLSELTSQVERKVGFLFRARRFSNLAHLLLYKAQTHAVIEYYIHV